IREPLERTTLQMQNNVENTAQTVSDYAGSGDPADAGRVKDLEVDFESLYAEFKRLANNDQLKSLSEQIDELHEQFRLSADEVITLIDERHTVLLLFEDDYNDLSSFIEDMLDPLVGGTSPDTVTKVQAILDMRSSLIELSMSLNTYIAEPDSSLSDQFQEAQTDFKEAHAGYEGTTLSPGEISSLNKIDEDFEEIVNGGTDILQSTDDLYILFDQFTESYSVLDTYLDDEVQPLVHTLARNSSDDAQSSVTSTGIWLLILGIAGIIIGVVSVRIISRYITRPLRQLMDGAKRVSSGRLDHRFNVDAKGEFGHLALAFNQLLDNLERSRDALAESEESAWALLDATSDAVILINNRGVIQASNELAAMRFSMSLEQMIDESLYDILPATQAASMKARITEAVRTGKSVHYEDEREAVIIDYNIFPISGAKGEVQRLAVFSRDITIRKWVEDVTDQLARRNELILKAAGQGIYGLDVEGKATFVNPAAAMMLGYDAEELAGQRHHEIVHHSKIDGKPYPNEKCPVHATLKDGTVHTSADDEVFWRKDGTYFPVEYTSTPIIEDGKILGAVVTFMDISDRKRLEKMLHQSEGMYRSFFQSPSSVIISIDREGAVLDCNTRIQQMLGYLPGEIIGQNLLDIVHPEDHTKVRECLNSALNRGFEYNNRFFMTRKDGISIEVTMNAAVARDAKGGYVRTICMIEEVGPPIKSQL
ncbi:PAS domain S-box protein, partial [Chloroflexota bacterium]